VAMVQAGAKLYVNKLSDQTYHELHIKHNSRHGLLDYNTM